MSEGMPYAASAESQDGLSQKQKELLRERDVRIILRYVNDKTKQTGHDRVYFHSIVRGIDFRTSSHEASMDKLMQYVPKMLRLGLLYSDMEEQERNEFFNYTKTGYMKTDLSLSLKPSRLLPKGAFDEMIKELYEVSPA